MLAHGTGALNIDGCRVAPTGESRERTGEASQERRYTETGGTNFAATPGVRGGDPAGRWPANLIHSGDDEVTGLLGSAARFFYCAKASKKDRDDGLEHMEAVHRPNGNKWTDQDYRVARGERSEGRESGPRKNTHPTVKPTDLMRYLCRLVTPPGGVVLDPFMGSGSTGKAAMLEGFSFMGFERDPDYFAVAKARVEAAKPKRRVEEPA